MNFEKQWHGKIQRQFTPECYQLKIYEAANTLATMKKSDSDHESYMIYVAILVIGAINHEGYQLRIEEQS